MRYGEAFRTPPGPACASHADRSESGACIHRGSSGTWERKGHQVEHLYGPETQERISYSLQLELKQTGRLLRGRILGRTSEGYHYEETVIGRVESDEYARISFRSRNP